MVKSRKDHKSQKPGSRSKKVSPTDATNQPLKQQAEGQHYLLLLSPTNSTSQPQSTSSQAPSTQQYTRQCQQGRGNSPVLLRGINRIRLPSRVGVFFEGGLRKRGVVVEEFGLGEEEPGLDEQGGRKQKRNEDVLSPNIRKTTDRRRLSLPPLDRPPPALERGGSKISRPLCTGRGMGRACC